MPVTTISSHQSAKHIIAWVQPSCAAIARPGSFHQLTLINHYSSSEDSACSAAAASSSSSSLVQLLTVLPATAVSG